jgi:hypothetical protein
MLIITLTRLFVVTWTQRRLVWMPSLGWVKYSGSLQEYIYTHTHVYMYIYNIYIYICLSVYIYLHNPIYIVIYNHHHTHNETTLVLSVWTEEARVNAESRLSQVQRQLQELQVQHAALDAEAKLLRRANEQVRPLTQSLSKGKVISPMSLTERRRGNVALSLGGCGMVWWKLTPPDFVTL